MKSYELIKQNRGIIWNHLKSYRDNVISCDIMRTHVNSCDVFANQQKSCDIKRNLMKSIHKSKELCDITKEHETNIKQTHEIISNHVTSCDVLTTIICEII